MHTKAKLINFASTFLVLGLWSSFAIANTTNSSTTETSTSSSTTSSSTATNLTTVNVQAVSRSTKTEGTNSFTSSAFSTTTGLNLLQHETPQSISVITTEYNKRRGIYDITKAISSTTGITVIKDAYNYRFMSRGFYIDQIQEDGLSTTVPGSASNAYRSATSYTDLSIYDHLEVVRGATGLTQVNSEPSGTINAVLKKPSPIAKTSIDASVDRFGATRLSVDTQGKLNEDGTLTGRVVATVARNKDFTTAKAGYLGLLYGVINWELSEKDTVTAGLILQNNTSTPNSYGLPYISASGEQLNLPRSTYLGADWSRNINRKVKVFVEHEHWFNDDWKYSTNLAYTRKLSTLKLAAIAATGTTYAGVPSTGLMSLNNKLRYDNQASEINFKTGVSGKVEFLGRTHQLFANYVYNQEIIKSNFYRVRDTTSYNLYTFDGSMVSEPDWTSPSDYIAYEDKFKTSSLQLGGRFELMDDLHLLAGLNYAYYKTRSFIDYIWWNGAADSDADSLTIRGYHATSPLFGLSYDLNAHHTVYASYARIFKPQSGLDINNNPVVPKRGFNYEVGLKSHWTGLNVNLALFRVVERNRAVYTGLQNSAGSYYYITAGKVRSQGVDFEVSGALTQRWNLFVGYTFNRSKYLFTESSTYTAGMNFSKVTPKHIFRVYSNYQVNEKWLLGAGFSYQSASESLYQNIRQGGYTLWNADVAYQATENLTLSVNFNNILDKKYWVNNRVRVNGANNFYGEPRNVQFNLNYTF
ncbi:TonB-dependent siderophore receptor [Psittacicella gerlachiana]|uniref:TonB-dependent siderophore receptor n=1 Tax=Psittacicella gerlachiana TaxID=2028574 RepID=A0A3A1Y9N9_9GAMM|nr:TonB-dependent siderophore receptor [Psittacicella gerlachiana]RIY34261.1 hypothetical protein CKF59_05760 [Psittacicella gerlachiana]